MGGNEAGAQANSMGGNEAGAQEIAWEGMKLALSWRSAVTRRVIGLLWCFAIMRCWREVA